MLKTPVFFALCAALAFTSFSTTQAQTEFVTHETYVEASWDTSYDSQIAYSYPANYPVESGLYIVPESVNHYPNTHSNEIILVTNVDPVASIQPSAAATYAPSHTNPPAAMTPPTPEVTYAPETTYAPEVTFTPAFSSGQPSCTPGGG